MSQSINKSELLQIEKNVIKGKKVCHDDEETSIGKFILDNLEKDSGFVGQIDPITGEEWSYGKMRERSVRCALWMKSQGLLPGDGVAICSNNHLDYAMPCFATLYVGAFYTPWDFELKRDDFLHRMSLTKPKIVFACESTVKAIAEASETAKIDLKIIVFGNVSGFTDFETAINEPEIDEVDNFTCTSIKSSDIALTMFSSGTTGPPKGVPLSYKALKMQLNHSESLGVAGKVWLSYSPISWINAEITMFMSIALNSPRFVVPSFEADTCCAIVEKYKINWIFLSPPMIKSLKKSLAYQRHDISSLNVVILTGAPLYDKNLLSIMKMFPAADAVDVFLGYGLTELGGYLCVQSKKSPVRSSGKLVDNAELKIVDSVTGRTLGANQRGELLLKSAYMMNFYHENPEATAKTIDSEGWLHTGDFGYYDRNNEVFVIDRLKDLIKCGNGYVCPSEIENVILFNPRVEEVAVIGKPNDEGDDFVIAFVVREKEEEEESLKTTNQVLESEIIEIVAAELPVSRRRGGISVQFVDDIPKLPVGKIRHAALRDLAKSIIVKY